MTKSADVLPASNSPDLRKRVMAALRRPGSGVIIVFARGFVDRWWLCELLSTCVRKWIAVRTIDFHSVTSEQSSVRYCWTVSS